MLRLGCAAIVLFYLAATPARADKRVALVIGNGAYHHAGTLANPVNDARDVAAALTPLGFQMILGSDLTKQALDLKLREFARALKDADVGVFFYAGHGLQVKGANYLVATDAKLEAEGDLDFETLRVDAVLAHMDREAKTNIVFLDACRNNPLARNLARTMGTRGVGENNGLAPVASFLGTFIAFATQPGAVASDGAGRNPPFSAALKKHIAAPGMSVTDLMVEVRKEVVGATKGAQVPWDHSALQGRFYFAAAAPTATHMTPTAPSPQLQLSDATQAWQLVKDTQSIPALEAFVRRFGDTFQGDLAKLRLAELQQAEATRQAAEAAKKKSEDDARTKAETERQRLASLQQDEERKRATRKKADEDARAKAEAERQRLAMLKQEEDRKSADTARKKADEDALLRIKAEVERQRLALYEVRRKIPGHVFRDCPECPEMVVVPAGRFIMGSPADQPERTTTPGWEDQVPVTIGKPFAVGRFAITRGEFTAFVSATGHKMEPCSTLLDGAAKLLPDQDWRSPGFPQTDRHPVVCVNWDDAKAYVTWLSAITGKSYSLPSEAEREYVARAGTTTTFWWGPSISPTQANYNGTAEPYKGGGTTGEWRKATVSVDTFAANPWGLYNVHGNVQEWTEDCWHDKHEHNPRDGKAWTGADCAWRIFRNGSWHGAPKYLRSAFRSSFNRTYRFYVRGFRVARTVD